jgi:hypothetical protein
MLSATSAVEHFARAYETQPSGAETFSTAVEERQDLANVVEPFKISIQRPLDNLHRPSSIVLLADLARRSVAQVIGPTAHRLSLDHSTPAVGPALRVTSRPRTLR